MNSIQNQNTIIDDYYIRLSPYDGDKHLTHRTRKLELRFNFPETKKEKYKNTVDLVFYGRDQKVFGVNFNLKNLITQAEICLKNLQLKSFTNDE